MAHASNIEGVLVQWGDRLFYPGNRIVRGRALPNLRSSSMSERAAVIRARIAATVVRLAPQVMVKVTGGGRGMRAIAAHFRYISKNGRLSIENELGEQMQGKGVLQELVDDWRFGGTLIGDISPKREAFNIMLSMPRGTDPLAVQRAAREFARVELDDHKYVMVLHDHQANPHVHISVRVESRHGWRLNPRKADLQHWRETFAEKLRERGIDAEATRQATRGRSQSYEALWRIKAREERRIWFGASGTVSEFEGRAQAIRAEAAQAWKQIELALMASGEQADRELALSIAKFVERLPVRSWPAQNVKKAEATLGAKSIDIDQRW